MLFRIPFRETEVSFVSLLPRKRTRQFTIELLSPEVQETRSNSSLTRERDRSGALTLWRQNNVQFGGVDSYSLWGKTKIWKHTPLPGELSQQPPDGLLQSPGYQGPAWRRHTHLQPLQVDSQRAGIGHSRAELRLPEFGQPTRELEEAGAPERGRVHDIVPVMTNQVCVPAISVRKEPEHMPEAHIGK